MPVPTTTNFSTGSRSMKAETIALSFNFVRVNKMRCIETEVGVQMEEITLRRVCICVRGTVSWRTSMWLARLRWSWLCSSSPSSTSLESVVCWSRTMDTPSLLVTITYLLTLR